MINNQYIVVVYDPSGYSKLNLLDFYPDLDHIERVGFMMYKGSIREVNDIHRTKSGVQIELFSLKY